MYLGIVASAIPEKKIDRKILLKRVSRTVRCKQMSHDQHFTDCATSNGLLKRADWHSVYVDDMSLADLILSLAQQYNLEDSVTAWLVLGRKVGKKNKR